MNPNAGLRYTPWLTAPESSEEFAADVDFLTCLDEEEEDEDDGEEVCAEAVPPTAMTTPYKENSREFGGNSYRHVT